MAARRGPVRASSARTSATPRGSRRSSPPSGPTSCSTSPARSPSRPRSPTRGPTSRSTRSAPSTCSRRCDGQAPSRSCSTPRPTRSTASSRTSKSSSATDAGRSATRRTASPESTATRLPLPLRLLEGGRRPVRDRLRADLRLAHAHLSSVLHLRHPSDGRRGPGMGRLVHHRLGARPAGLDLRRRSPDPRPALDRRLARPLRGGHRRRRARSHRRIQRRRRRRTTLSRCSSCSTFSSASNGRPLEVRFDAWRPGDQRVFVCDTARAERDLGWRPRRPSPRASPDFTTGSAPSGSCSSGTSGPRLERSRRLAVTSQPAPPHLLVVAPSAYPLGGVATWLDDLVPGLERAGWRVTVGLTAGRHHDVSRLSGAPPLPPGGRDRGPDRNAGGPAPRDRGADRTRAARLGTFVQRARPG